MLQGPTYLMNPRERRYSTSAPIRKQMTYHRELPERPTYARQQMESYRPFGYCPSGDYGGCGTFLGKTKDEAKRACWLEKKIAKFQRKCEQGGFLVNKKRSCRKYEQFTAELASIQGPETPETLQMASDMAMYQAQQALASGQAHAQAQAAQTGWMIPAAIGGALFLVGAAVLLKR